MTAIGTVCSLTLNGVLMRCGIHARPRYGGVVAIHRGIPEAFTAFLGSGRSMLAPLDAFLSGGMTSVCSAMRNGTGEVLGSFLEIPDGLAESAKHICDRIKQTGLGVKIIFGPQSEPLLGMPVSIGTSGMVVFRDINIVAALMESSIQLSGPAIKILYPFELLRAPNGH